MAIEVYTRKQLATAIKNKEKWIAICDDDLAKKIKKFKGKKDLDNYGPNASAGMLLGGMEIVYLVGLLILGAAVLYSIHKDYNVEVGNDKYKLKLKRT